MGGWSDHVSMPYQAGYPGYDDESLNIEINENLAEYYDENGWVSVLTSFNYNISNAQLIVATDSFNIDFLKSTGACTTLRDILHLPSRWSRV